MQTKFYDYRSMGITRYKDAIFIPLPPDQWRECNGCACDVCKADETGGYFDTLALAKDAPKNAPLSDYTYMVHYPALHPVEVRKAKAYSASHSLSTGSRH